MFRNINLLYQYYIFLVDIENIRLKMKIVTHEKSLLNLNIIKNQPRYFNLGNLNFLQKGPDLLEIALCDLFFDGVSGRKLNRDIGLNAYHRSYEKKNCFGSEIRIQVFSTRLVLELW